MTEKVWLDYQFLLIFNATQLELPQVHYVNARKARESPFPDWPTSQPETGNGLKENLVSAFKIRITTRL